MIDAYEERDVALMEIPGAYLSSDMNDDVFMIFRGTTTELMVVADPKIYPKYISYRKKGEALLYVHVQKALYGCLNSAIIFMRNWLVT